MDLTKLLLIAAVVAFGLAAVGIGSLPWVPIGLACFAGSFLA